MTHEIPPIRENPSTTPTDQHYSLAIHEHLLDGPTEAEKVAQAEALGVAGIEYDATGLDERVQAIREALKNSTVRAATVRYQGQLIDPDASVRSQALDDLRYAMVAAVDIGASGVVVAPHRGPLNLPDLMPLKAPIQIAVELMVLHLRAYSDLAYVFDINLYLLPRPETESAFLNTLAEGAELRRRIKNHAHVLLAADLRHTDSITALQPHAKALGHLYLQPDSIDFQAVYAALQQNGPGGWAAITGEGAGNPRLDSLKSTMRALQTGGFSA